MTQEVDVLLVEDNQADITLTLRAMTQEIPSNRVHIARDGEEALTYVLPTPSAPRSAPRLRLILLDLKLPKLSGFDVLARLKSNLQAKLIPVVILSSSNQDNDVLKSYELGANSYLQKPMDFDEFRDLIRRVTRYWLNLNLTSVSPLSAPAEKGTADLQRMFRS